MNSLYNMEEEQQKAENKKQINIISLIKSPQDFRRTFEELRRLGGQNLKLQEYDSAVEYYLKALDMLELGKNLLNNINPFSKACLLISLAAAYQGGWKIQKTNKFCDKGEEELLRLLGEEKQQFLKVSNHLVTLKFQHCAIYSQLNQHQKALEMCKSTFPLLTKAIDIIETYCRSQQQALIAQSGQEGVMFSKKVYGFARPILSSLTTQLADSVCPKQSKSSHFYFWQRNPQKNEQQLKKLFLPQSNSNSKRSILGVNKQNHWVDEFNIGAIMRMTQLKAQIFEKVVPMEEYLFKDKLYEIVILCSLAFFTIATEMRFIDAEKAGDGTEIKPQKQGSKFESIRRKYGYQQKSQLFRLSEAYHLRAIQIVSMNIQAPIPYLTHMIKSYDKHYVFKKKLEEIAALGEESLLETSSIIHSNNHNSKLFSKIRPQTQPSEQPYGNEIQVINRQQTEEDEQVYNDYQESKTSPHRKTQDIGRKQDKDARNTIKYVHSQPHQELKGRAKSVGKLRKTKIKLSPKDEPSDKNIGNQTTRQKAPKKKQKKQKQLKTQRQKQKQMKKTRVKLADIEGEGQLHVRTKSSTHIKFVFKKKK